MSRLQEISPEAALQYVVSGGCSLDVRAPIEFEAGALPGAVNAPILNNTVREAVGKIYKSQGQQAAVNLGHRLVGGSERSQRIAEWCQIVRQNNIGVIYCFRGGMRSGLAQSWLADCGVDIQRVVGGYKALRRILLEKLEQSSINSRFILLSGPTGSGKTKALRVAQETVPVLDLEALAGHRGSAFGSYFVGQPNQANFENALAMQLMKEAGRAPILVEDESRSIGGVILPKALFCAIDQSPRIVLEVSLSDRVHNIREEYIDEALQELCCLTTDADALSLLREKYLSGLSRISKALGNMRYREVVSLMKAAFQQQETGRGSDAHEGWIQFLLAHYYDPYYQRHLEERKSTIRYRFDLESFQQWILSARS